MTWLEYVVAIAFVLACSVSSSLLLLHRARGIIVHEQECGIATPRLREIASVLGAVAGLAIGVIVLFFAEQTASVNVSECEGKGECE